MADWLMHVLAPRSAWGFVVRLVLLTGLVAAANLGFSLVFYHHEHPASYYIAHALVVGGPLIAFFLAVTVFQIRLQRKLARLSRQDSLTGLRNRRSFFDILDKIRATDARGVLLLLDADHFKAINDTHGHLAGDNCLRSIAYTIQRCVRKEDLVGRIGGEEFAIYLRATTRGQAKVIGERLTLPISFRNSNDDIMSVTLSIGAAVGIPGQSVDELFVSADRALYDAKLEGRARMIFAIQDLAA